MKKLSGKRSFVQFFHEKLSLPINLSERLQAYQNATGLTDDEIELIRQKSNLRYIDNDRIAQYAYNDGDLQGLVPEIIWNDEIINIGIGIGLNQLIFFSSKFSCPSKKSDSSGIYAKLSN